MKNRPFTLVFLLLFLCPQSSIAANKQANLPWLTLLLSEQKISLSGSIGIASGLVVDNDVNDPLGQNGPRNDPGDPDVDPGTNYPQKVPSPVTIAGYVNTAGKGPNGSSYLNGDYDDYYMVDLEEGQTITLNIADQNTGDLDLYLYNSAGDTIEDSSIGTDKTEQLTIAAGKAGTYIVNVNAFSGAGNNYSAFSNYTLVIGQNTGGSANVSSLRLTDNFVVGEAVVRLEEQQAMAAGVQTAAGTAGAYSMTAKAGAPDRNMLWSLDLSETMPGTLQSIGASNETVHYPKRQFVNPELLEKYDTLMAIKELRKKSGIKYADPNYIVQAAAVPNDTYYSYQWHYPLINLPDAWDITTGTPASGDVIVAVVDTGVLLAHPDLQSKLVSGYDFISNPSQALDGDGLDPDPDDPGDRASANGSSFHGTHVAGTVAAASNNGTGVAGVAWGAKIMPLRVLGYQGGTSYDIGQACLYAAGLANDSGTLPPTRADVINMSIQGYGSYSQADQNVFIQVRNAGVIIVACSGNKNQYTTSYPGSYTGVVSVASVDMNKNRAPYSNYHSTVDVAAPGGDSTVDQNGDGYPDGVLSTGGDDSSGSIRTNYRFMQGTSMASPHMAGVVALMEAAARDSTPSYDLTPSQLDSLLSSGKITEDIGTAGRDDEFGWGLIDAHKAVQEAKGTPAVTPNLVISPTALNFGTDQTTTSLTATNNGGGTLNVLGVTDDAAWLTVSGSGLGTYTVTINRTGLATGTYSATITFDSDQNDPTVSVIMSVPDSSTVSSNAGFHYVLLLDAEETDVNKQVKAQYNVAAKSGVYHYSFSRIKAGGRYRIVAGTDYNNDGYVCDPGEACGAYLTLDQPLILENLTTEKNNINFTTGFQVQLSPAQVSGGGLPFRGWPLLTNPVEKIEKK